ncbi:MAG TPA: response regulator transcription factor [Anaerolineales bacterium]
MTRVLLIAPIPAMRLGLRALLSDSEVEIIGEADRLDSPDLSDAEADVIVYASASASLPDPEPDSGKPAAFLLLTDDPHIVPALTRSHRPWGVLSLDSSREELLAAIHALSEGLIVGAAPLLESLLNPRALNRADSESPPLSDREIEVLELLAQGLANKQIAAALGISEHTAKFHVSSIYTKLIVTNRAEAVRQGVRRGLIAI